MGGDLGSILGSGISGWNVLFAAIAIIAAWILSIFARKGALALARKVPNLGETGATLTARIVKYAVILVGVGVGLAFLGASVQPVLAIALIIGIVLALVLRGVADNFASGVLLQSRHPIKLGDEIEIDDEVGVVQELNGRSVILRTVDGRHVHVPNSTVTQGIFANHSTGGARRAEIEVRARWTEPAEAFAELLAAAVAEVEGVHRREAPAVLLVTIAPDRVTARVRFWHHPLHRASVASAVVARLASVLRERDVEAVVTSAEPEAPLTPPAAL